MTQLAERLQEPAPLEAAAYSPARLILMRRHLEHLHSQAATASGQLARQEKRFEDLAQAWVEETNAVSSTTELIGHWAYMAIVRMGSAAVPFLLREMAEEPDHWGPALETLTGENPVSSEHIGDVEAMARDWVNWGKARRILR